MVPASKDGGERITSYQQFVLVYYSFGRRVNHGNYSGINLCTSMHTSVSSEPYYMIHTKWFISFYSIHKQVAFSIFNSDIKKEFCTDWRHSANVTIWTSPLKVFIRGCGVDWAFCCHFYLLATCIKHTILGHCINYHSTKMLRGRCLRWVYCSSYYLSAIRQR